MNYPTVSLHVAGRWITQATGGERLLHNPADGSVLGSLPLACEEELQAATDSARRGFAAWRRVSPHQRHAVLRRAAELMRQRAERIATVLTLEQGKPLSEALREVTLSADILDFQAE
ncbi:MAG: aldehyde dehydrogenase family protein, partial [Aquincola tertiaricarbonis]